MEAEEETARRGKKPDRGMTRKVERDRSDGVKEIAREREKEGRRWCSRKAVGGGDGLVEQKGCGECGKGGTPMEENDGVAAAG